MDKEHRHELEVNDLQEFLLHFREWWGRWGTYVLIVVVLGCAGVLGWITLSQRAAAARRSAWDDLATADTPQILEKVASEHNIKEVKILASLRSADLYLAEYLKPAKTAASTQPAQNNFTPKQKLDHAEAMYRQVLSLTKQPLYRINALMGLASVGEDRKNWTDARNNYQQAKTLAKQAGFINLAKDASARLAYLPKLKKPVIFSPPATQPATEPATRSAARSAANAASHPVIKPLLKLPKKPAATQP